MKKLVVMLVACFAVVVAFTPLAVAQISWETFVTLPDQAEGLAIDEEGNVFAGLIFTGEILKITPQGEISVFATVPGVSPESAWLVGLTFDGYGDLFAAFASFVPEYTTGVYKITEDGTQVELFATGTPETPMALPNDVLFDENGNLFVSDSFAGAIFKVTPEGEVSVFKTDPSLLTVNPDLGFGANGIVFDTEGNLFVANTGEGTILKITVNPDGTAGDIEQIAEDLVGADGIVFDAAGNLYVAQNVADRIVIISPEGAVSVLASGYPLESPASLELRGSSLFVTNLDFFSPEPPYTISVYYTEHVTGEVATIEDRLSTVEDRADTLGTTSWMALGLAIVAIILGAASLARRKR